MAEARSYSDFDVIVEPEGAEYRARVVDSPAGEATAMFAVPFSELELENFLLRVGRPRRGTRRLESEEMEAAREFGARLFDAMFHDDVEMSLQRSLDAVERRGEGLRIRLRFSDTPELASLPWEFLYNEDSDEFLVLSAWTPIIRYLDLTQTIEPLTVTGPVRILVMISGPEDYPSLDVEEEWRRIERSLAGLIDAGAVMVTRTEGATLLDLQRALRQHDYHIFHFLGHGGFDEKADDGVLVLENENHRSRLAAGRDLGTILHDHRSLRLAVLNACEGARASDSDPFSGAAQSLVRKGIPAVVAMQFEITDDAAIAFAQEFYSAIADALPVDAAIGEARRAIFGLGNDIEWGTPVVYLRGDGQLFTIETPVKPVARVTASDEEEEPTTEPPVVAATAATALGAETDRAPTDEPVQTRGFARLPTWVWGAAGGLVIAVAAGAFALIGGGEPTTAPPGTEAPTTTAAEITVPTKDLPVTPQSFVTTTTVDTSSTTEATDTTLGTATTLTPPVTRAPTTTEGQTPAGTTETTVATPTTATTNTTEPPQTTETTVPHRVIPPNPPHESWLADDLLLYFPYDGSINDASPSRVPTTQTGQVDFVSGVYGQAAQFDGSGEKVEAGDSSLRWGDMLTMELWVNMDDWRNPYQGSAHVESMAQVSTFFTVYVNFDTWRLGAFVAATDEGEWKWTNVGESGRLTPGEWYHVALIHDGSAGRAHLYLDGELVDSQPIPGVFPPFPSGAFTMGTWFQTNQAFAGALDDVRLYTTVLPPNVIADHAGY